MIAILVMVGAWATACSGTAGCFGDAQACYLRSEVHCVEGCAMARACNPIECGQVRAMVECEEYPHCDWIEDAERCQGRDPIPDCIAEDESSCQSQPGCIWEFGCNGDPRPCYEYAGEASCNRARGCEWMVGPAF